MSGLPTGSWGYPVGMAGQAVEALRMVAIVDGGLVPVVEVGGVLVDAETGAPLDPVEVVLLGLDVVAA